MGLLDDNVPDDSRTQSDTVVRDAEVVFTDGTTARFSAVQFLPDGRLKAFVTTFVAVANKQHPVSGITYYASGSWESVQEPARGIIVVDVERPTPDGGAFSEVITAGCFERQGPQNVIEWMKKRWPTRVIKPKSPADILDWNELLSTEFEYYEESPHYPQKFQLVEKVRFRWVQPKSPTESVRRRPPS
ncbi:hypothetical protein [Mycobacterium kansasii]|uniref:hypothetical protein n=1 Tax=Mycobacterium kansasii TaxID=1768 RepID=UPI003A8416FD